MCDRGPQWPEESKDGRVLCDLNIKPYLVGVTLDHSHQCHVTVTLRRFDSLRLCGDAFGSFASGGCCLASDVTVVISTNKLANNYRFAWM